MTSGQDALADAITATIPALLTALEAFEQVEADAASGRGEQAAAALEPFRTGLAELAEQFDALSFPEHLQPLRARISDSAKYALRACDNIDRHQEGYRTLLRAIRAHCRSQEIIFDLAGVMRPVSQYFLEPAARHLTSLLDALQQGNEHPDRGVLQARNTREERSGFSLYVPENLASDTPVSLVFALHGGSGHGADFLWSWVREARTRGFIVIAPTSSGDTWSLRQTEVDHRSLLSMLGWIRDRWNIDDSHILLSGMSDGGTFSLQAGLAAREPFTHLACFSGVLNPMISMQGHLANASERPIWLVHGTADWMFPVERAHTARAELDAAGANVVFHEIDGLAHTYARAEHPALIEWFNPALTVPV